jgi:hypothetical protein
MPGPNRIDSTPIRLSTRTTEARQTPDDSFGKRIANGAVTTAGVVANGAAVASNFVPGGSIVSAAVSGVGGMASGGASAVGSGIGGGAVGSSFVTGASVPGSVTSGGVGTSVGGSTVPTVSSSDPTMASFSSMLNQQAASNTQYLMLQNQMQQENQVFSTLSNVLKVRHDTAKNSISNIH